MTIPALPSLDRTSPTFKADLDTFFLTELPDTVTALNSELTRIDGILPVGFVATSTTSLTIAASGTVTLTVQTNKGFATGQFVAISVTADPAKQMSGTVTAYDHTTGVLSVSVSQSAGSGTYAAWTVAISTASASPYSTGDIALTNRTLSAPDWLPADGAVYSQSSYAALYAELGLVRDGLTQQFTTVFSALANNSASGFGQAAEGYTAYPLFAHDSKFCCYSKTTGATTHKLNRSTGGITWSAVAMPNTTNDTAYVGFAVIGSVMIAVSPAGDNWVARSTDGGATWTTNGFGISAATGRNPPFVLNNLFVIMVGGTTAYYTSPDGIAWTTRTAPAALQPRGVAGGVAFATTGSIPFSVVYTTTDAVTWTSRSLPASGSYYEFAHLGGVWLTWNSASPYNYLRSTNGGATWTSHTYGLIVTVYPYNGLRVHKGRFRFASTSHITPSMHSSADGLTWTQDPIPNYGYFPTVTFSPSLVITDTEMYWFDQASQYVAWVSSDAGQTWQYHPAYSTTVSYANFRTATEVGGVQVMLADASTLVLRRPIYTYNSATQFAVPQVQAAPGVTAYIKA